MNIFLSLPLVFLFLLFTDLQAGEDETTKPTQLKTLYPEIVTTSGFLSVDGIKIYYEEAGNKDGIPVVFVHGGPGWQFSNRDLTFFNPEKYRIIAFDQRGCGQSVPSANNIDVPSNYYDEVNIGLYADDMEKLRKQLKVDKWLVFGGSWGSTLSLYYVQNFPENVLGLVLRGIFLASNEQIKGITDAKVLKENIPGWDIESLNLLVSYANSKNEKFDMNDPLTLLEAYYRMCVLQNDFIAMHLWTLYETYNDESTTEDLINLKKLPKTAADLGLSVRSVGIFETLFFSRLAKQQFDLLDEAKIRNLKPFKTYIVQGAKDTLCFPKYAQKLNKALTQQGCTVFYYEIPEGHHTPFSPEMTNRLVDITDNFTP